MESCRPPSWALSIVARLPLTAELERADKNQRDEKLDRAEGAGEGADRAERAERDFFASRAQSDSIRFR